MGFLFDYLRTTVFISVSRVFAQKMFGQPNRKSLLQMSIFFEADKMRLLYNFMFLQLGSPTTLQYTKVQKYFLIKK